MPFNEGCLVQDEIIVVCCTPYIWTSCVICVYKVSTFIKTLLMYITYDRCSYIDTHCFNCLCCFKLQLRDESYSSWRTASVSEVDATGSSPPHSGSPRPQTPAFPVHPRTPYVNSSSNQFDSPTVGLPPKSPTAQR